MPPKAVAAATTNGPKAAQNPNSAATPTAPSTERNKVVVRKCPPELPEAVFWRSVESWVDDDSVDWKEFKQGRSRGDRQNKENLESVAYIHFKKQDSIPKFAQNYQGHVFRDSKGQQSHVVVEYAPFQKTPAKKQKPDPLAGTIDDDADYLAFVKSLTEPENKATQVVTDAPPPPKAPQNKITPLLEELRRTKQSALDKKAAKTDKSHSKVEGKSTRSARRAAAAAKATVTGTSAPTVTGGQTSAAASQQVPKTGEKAKAGPQMTERQGKAQSERPAKGKGSKGAPQKPTAEGQPGSAAPSPSGKQQQQPPKSQAQKNKGPKPAKQEEAPKMTILAPPRPAASNTNAADKGSPATLNTQSQAPKTNQRPPPLEGFDDIVNQMMGPQKAMSNSNAGVTSPSAVSKEVTASSGTQGHTSQERGGRGGQQRGGRGGRGGSAGRGGRAASTSLAGTPGMEIQGGNVPQQGGHGQAPSTANNASRGRGGQGSRGGRGGGGANFRGRGGFGGPSAPAPASSPAIQVQQRLPQATPAGPP